MSGLSVTDFMIMDVIIILKLLVCVLLFTKASDANICTSAKCSLLSPEIRFPFRVQGFHQCGLPQFNLFCEQNRTMIHFPTYGDLVVESISYDTRRLSLLDPKNCVHEVFLNLNLSLTPFSYYYVLRQYKYINCSTKLAGSFEQVPCLSSSDHHVYTVEPSFSEPVSCSSVKTVAAPFSYSPYLSDNSFGLGLTWNSTGVNEEEAYSVCKLGILCDIGHIWKYSRALCAVPGIIAFVFVVGKQLCASLSRYCNKFNAGKEKKTLGEEIEKLLGNVNAVTL